MNRQFGDQYKKLINKWEFTRTNPTAPFIGRRHKEILTDLYYVNSEYVDEGAPTRYEAIESKMVYYPYYT
jgi:hypothetical protein